VFGTDNDGLFDIKQPTASIVSAKMSKSDVNMTLNSIGAENAD
jgi:hypothetical protein